MKKAYIPLKRYSARDILGTVAKKLIRGFTLIEIVIVIVIITILMAVVMRFGSGRIVQLQSQSLKEEFVSRYNELYSQNLTSSSRGGQRYQRLTIGRDTGVRYRLDAGQPLHDPKLSDLQFRDLAVDGDDQSAVQLELRPYRLGCSSTGQLFAFTAYVPKNGKSYCFEIAMDTCKLVEVKCE